MLSTTSFPVTPDLIRGPASSFLALALAALATPALALAQDDQRAAIDACHADPDCSYDPPGEHRDVVVTAARAEQDARDVGQAVTVVSREELERRQAVNLADLLATTPGVTVSRNGAPGSLTTLRIRGAEGDQTLVVIDGVRVNDPSSTGGGFDFANLLAGSVERVEVLRGPDSVPWGSQAIGGVVNVVTAVPRPGLQARGQAEYGWRDSFYGNAGISGQSGAFSGALTAGYLRTDGLSSAAVGSERDGYRQYGATGRVGVEFAPGLSLDLRGYWADSRVELDGYPAPTYTFADTDEYQKTQELYGYAGLNVDLLGGRLRNRIAFTIADIDRDNFDPAFGTDPSFIGRGRTERYEYQGDFRLADPLRLVFGAEHEDSRYGDGFDRFSTGITSGYLQAIVKPIERLTLTGGARYDDHKRFGGNWTFAGNGAFTIGRGTTLRASYAEGFKAPTLYQLFSAYGNRALDPETARNWDAGIAQRIGDMVELSATYFNRRTRNQIDFRACDGAAECADYPFGRYDNIARTRADGVELAATLRPRENVNFGVVYSYINAHNRSIGVNFGNELARRPRHSVTVNADWRTPWGVAIGGTITHVGDTFDNIGNTVRLDGYALASLRAELPLGDRLALYGRVENLFDEQYQTVAGYGTPGRAAFGGVRLRLK